MSDQAGSQTGSEVADRVSAVVLAVPGVSGLHGGAFGEVATYLPGRSVAGVRLQPEVSEVHLVVDAAAEILEVAGAVRVAVQAVVPDVPVDVFVDDVQTEAFDAAAAMDAPTG